MLTNALWKKAALASTPNDLPRVAQRSGAGIGAAPGPRFDLPASRNSRTAEAPRNPRSRAATTGIRVHTMLPTRPALTSANRLPTAARGRNSPKRGPGATEAATREGHKFRPWRSGQGACCGDRMPCRMGAAHGEMQMRKGNGKDNGAVSSAPWDDQVAHLMRREGMPRDKARDRVILESLKRGDCDALAALLIDGHVPAPNLRFVLALMLLDNEEADAAIARHHADPDPWWLPYRLVIKARPAKPRRSHGAEQAAGERGTGKSGPVMPALGYEAAIARLDQAVRATDIGGRTAAPGQQVTRRARPAHKRKR